MGEPTQQSCSIGGLCKRGKKADCVFEYALSHFESIRVSLPRFVRSGRELQVESVVESYRAAAAEQGLLVSHGRLRRRRARLQRGLSLLRWVFLAGILVFFFEPGS